MQRKFIHIFTICVVSTFLVEASAFAQEGEGLPIKPPIESIEKDSVNLDESNSGEEMKSEMLPAVTITPRDQRPSNTPLESTPLRPETKKVERIQGEKTKEQENPSNLSFNFLHYLLYKFKVGSTSGN